MILYNNNNNQGVFLELIVAAKKRKLGLLESIQDKSKYNFKDTFLKKKTDNKFFGVSMFL